MSKLSGQYKSIVMGNIALFYLYIYENDMLY